MATRIEYRVEIIGRNLRKLFSIGQQLLYFFIRLKSLRSLRLTLRGITFRVYRRLSALRRCQNYFRTSITEYTRHGRGTKGMIAIQQTGRNGKVVAATLVHADDEIMLITDKGVLVRTRVSEIRELGRATQGVTLIGLDEGSKLSGLQRIVENDAQAEAGEASDDAGEAADGTGEPAQD